MMAPGRLIDFVPFVRVGGVLIDSSRADVRHAVGLPRSETTRFYWVETFGTLGGPSWFVGYDEAGVVVHVQAHPSFDPVNIPVGVRPGLMRAEVWRLAGPPPIAQPARDHFSDGDVFVAVEYDDQFRAAFIEVSGHADVVLDDLHLLTTPADDLIASIPYARAPPRSPFAARTEPRYPEVGLALWRSAVPEDDPDDTSLHRFSSASLARRGYW